MEAEVAQRDIRKPSPRHAAIIRMHARAKYAHTGARIHARTHAYARTGTHIHTNARAHMRAHARIRSLVHAHAIICKHVHAYARICTYMRTHMRAYAHAQTYTHTHLRQEQQPVAAAARRGLLIALGRVPPPDHTPCR